MAIHRASRSQITSFKHRRRPTYTVPRDLPRFRWEINRAATLHHQATGGHGIAYTLYVEIDGAWKELPTYYARSRPAMAMGEAVVRDLIKRGILRIAQEGGTS